MKMSRKAEAKTDSCSAREPFNEIDSNRNRPFEDSNGVGSTSTGALYDGSVSATSLRRTATASTLANKSNDGKTAGTTEPILPVVQGHGETRATKKPGHNALKRESGDPSNRSSGNRGLVMSFFQETIPSFLAVSVMLSLIFGGCCSNVFALEAIIKGNPDSGKPILHTFPLPQRIRPLFPPLCAGKRGK